MGTPKRTGPVALTNTLTTNVMQGGGGNSSIMDVITHIHVVNKTGSSAHFSLWLGATNANTAGTELFNGQLVAANDKFDYYCRKPLKSTEFIVGGSDTPTALTITIESDQVVVP